MGTKKFDGLEKGDRQTLIHALSAASEAETTKLNRLYTDPRPTAEIRLCIEQREELLEKLNKLRKDLIDPAKK